MTYDSLVNRGDYFSAHYLAEILPKDLKSGLLAAWKEREETAAAAAARAGEAAKVQAEAGPEAEQAAEAEAEGLPVTPRAGLRELRRAYFRSRAFFAQPAADAEAAGDDSTATASASRTAALAADDAATYDNPRWRERVTALNSSVLRALGYDAKPQTLTVRRADQEHEVRVAHAEPGLVALDCGWAAEPDDALDPQGPGRLLHPLVLDAQTTLATGSKLASHLFASEDPPRYVLLLTGGVLVLADRAVWGEGRYLAVSLDTALERNDTKAGGELDTIAALFGADSLRTPEEGGENPLATLVDKSAKHAVGVSGELRDGLRLSVELIANEVLDRIREAGVQPGQVKELPELGRQLTRDSLRYLYRILFLLYAEARPELGILPSDYPEYQQGYGMARLGELVAEHPVLVGDKTRRGFHLYDSLDLLFTKVQQGHRPRRTHGEAAEAVTGSEDLGLRFEPLHSTLFDASSIQLIGRASVPDPRVDEDENGEPRHLDTRLRNETLHRVLRHLMIAKGRKGERGGFISYAQLGINQLGAVYEGLMSYTGFIADEELYEVAKNGDPKDGSWLVPASKADEYPDSVRVMRRDEDTGAEVWVRYAPGSFVYRLSGRDRQTSASYYTPESLTRVTVQLALQHRLDQDGETTPARELLDWKICEPALGSGAFLNEAINQVAAEYLRRRQTELGTTIDTERYAVELQKVKAYIALHNCYGVDLNDTAVELAEVSLWLNTMHPGMEAPWYGLHLRRGNSLIGGRREVYPPEKLRKAAWLGTTPERFPLSEAAGGLPTTTTESKTRSGTFRTVTENAVHHFLLPAKEWGAVAAEKEAKALAPEDAKKLAAWRKAITRTPTAKQSERLQGLARRVEYLWKLVVRRLEISERDISRRIDVWGAEDDWLRSPKVAVQRDEVRAELEAPDTPYWRLKTLMDAWCALWFWPVQDAALLDGSAEVYKRATPLPLTPQLADPAPETEPADALPLTWESEALPGLAPDNEQLTLTPPTPRKRPSTRRNLNPRDRKATPLATLDDWLTFAEALVGTHDVPRDSLVSHFENLTELSTYEDDLPALMGMEAAHHLEGHFPWTSTAKDITDRQGFFHWELEFAYIFANYGGYDLQVGNPPWVRPRWQEDVVLAEAEPWFSLTEKSTIAEWRLRKTETLHRNNGAALAYFTQELTTNSGMTAYLGNGTTYPLLVGTHPDLYRAFMCKTWSNCNFQGITGLIHSDTHFGGIKEGPLREATYKRLRFHAHYWNQRHIFSENKETLQFSMNIYGRKQRPHFPHASLLFAPETLTASLDHSGSGDLPGIKHKGSWDVRPHRARLVTVNLNRLKEWNRLTTGGVSPDREAPLLYPVTAEEEGAISSLSQATERVGSHQPHISPGYHEATGKQEGYIRWESSTPQRLEEVILQGPHFGIATPFEKQPNSPLRNRNDYTDWDLTSLPRNAIPRTNYLRACELNRFLGAQVRWNGQPYTNFFRLAWRVMIPMDTERSLSAALLPPGPAHVHTVHSMALPTNHLTALCAGFWAALPLDYLLRITRRRHLQVSEARMMPMPLPDHPLESALLLRILRLNCLTEAYSPLWSELYRQDWRTDEQWAYHWPTISPLSDGLGPVWEYDTPLRTEFERRAALIEIDSLVAVWLGITSEQLITIYKTHYYILAQRDEEIYFDAQGRRIAGNHHSYGHGQRKETYSELLAHLADPSNIPPPSGYMAPFYKADREAEMRATHAHFQGLMDSREATNC
ncbi:restriction endonuclease [Streptomyces aidingensis]|uniref:site-specific DNA-methyltransferase (adenine-specific) n=1 Tax=Streptomyces aidingensis TaxID=910347 RepID=A0A1I1TJL8_9ACTN|nr:restriction endonuclease [Streptomyces aidingensis]SFD58725.1 hypothetical protein SAMN05421773_12010 [Streptomyces aidingensis]